MAQYELNVIDYWLILKKRKYLILVSAGLVVFFTFVFSEWLKPAPLYEAVARVKFERSTTVAQQLLDAPEAASREDGGLGVVAHRVVLPSGLCAWCGTHHSSALASQQERRSQIQIQGSVPILQRKRFHISTGHERRRIYQDM